MVLLLGSRGQYRGRSSSGFVGTLRRFSATALQFLGIGRPANLRRGETRASRGSTVSGWLALGGALLFFAVGYLVGHSTSNAAPGNGSAGLKADGNGAAGPTAPAIIGEFDARPLGSEAFAVVAYQLDAAAGKARAKALSDWLRARDLQKARPFEYPGKDGPLWIVAVYFDGAAEEAATRERLKQLPADVPDDVFASQRANPKWPVAVKVPIQ